MPSQASPILTLVYPPKILPPKHMYPASITLLSSFMPSPIKTLFHIHHTNTLHQIPSSTRALTASFTKAPSSITSAHKHDSLHFNSLKIGNHQSSPLPRHHPPQPNIFQYHKPQLSRYHTSPVRYFLHSLVQSQYAKLFLISPHLQ